MPKFVSFIDMGLSLFFTLFLLCPRWSMGADTPELVYGRPDISADRVIFFQPLNSAGNRLDGFQSYTDQIQQGWTALFGSSNTTPVPAAALKQFKNLPALFYSKLIQSFDSTNSHAPLSSDNQVRDVTRAITDTVGDRDFAFTFILGDEQSYNKGQKVQTYIGLFDTQNLTWKWVVKTSARKSGSENWKAASNVMLSDCFGFAKKIRGRFRVTAVSEGSAMLEGSFDNVKPSDQVYSTSGKTPGKIIWISGTMALISVPALTQVRVGETFDVLEENHQAPTAPRTKSFDRLTLLAGTNLSAPSYTDTSLVITGTSSSIGIGADFGVALEVPLLEQIGIEAGVFTFKRTFTLETDSSIGTLFADNEYYTIHFPILFRFHIDSHFSLGLGGYYTRNPSFVSADSLKAYDAGAVFSARYEHELNEKFLIALDVRYQYGLVNVSTVPSAMINMRDYQFLAGLVFKLETH